MRTPINQTVTARTGRASVRRVCRGVVVAVLSALLVVTVTGNAFGLAPGEDEADRSDGPEVDPPVVTEVKPVRAGRDEDIGVPTGPDPKAQWPTAGRATVDLADASRGVMRDAAGLPVEVGPPQGQTRVARTDATGSASEVPERVSVELLDRATSERVGVSGPVMRLDAAQGGRARVRLDLSDYAEAFGGAWASRLRLVAYPACVLERPEDPECATPTRLETSRAADGKGLAADVELPDRTTGASAPATSQGLMMPGPSPDPGPAPSEAAAGTTTDEPASGPSDGPSPDEAVPAEEPTAPSPASWRSDSATITTAAFVQTSSATAPAPTEESGTVVAATAEASGEKGDWTATSLKSAANWSAGGSTGSFTWSYGFRAPEVAGGLAPKLKLGYDSGSVDGQTSAENNQPGWAGVGWSLSPGFIERSYTTCGTDATKDGSNNSGRKTGDLCWDDEPLAMSFGSHAGELIPVEGSPGEFRLRNDDETKVERVGVKGGAAEHFKVTTPDGTRYWFGKENAAAAGTESAWQVPVFGNHAGEPGHASTFAASWKRVTWRWNLAYVVDPAGNSMTYHWAEESNRYGRNRDQAVSTYDRGGWLSRIDYGTHTSQPQGATAPARVLFGVAERCLPKAAPCQPGDLTADTASEWPDVPYDQICTSSTSCGIEQSAPTFFTRKRLASLTTQVATGADAWRRADRWTLNHKFPDPGDGDRVLWLDSVTQQHMGTPIEFGGAPMDNRVDGVDNATALMRWRVTTITDEFGKQLTVNYSDPDAGQYAGRHCEPADVPAEPASNTRLCFPVEYTPPGNFEPDEDPHWFHKYLVTAVTQHDNTGATLADQATSYTYRGDPAWAKNDNPRIPAKHRTWDQWRGFGKVEVRQGTGDDGPRTFSATRYFRGMHKDPDGSGGQKTASVTDSTGTASTDHRWLAGRVREDETFNGPGGERLSSTITDYQSVLTTSKTGTRAPRRVVVKATQQRKPVAGGATQRVDVVNTYDDHGRLTSRDDRAYTVASGGGQTQTDRLCTTTKYATNLSTWMLSYPKSTKTVSVGCGVTSPGISATVSATRTAYDDQTIGTAPTQGLVTRTEELDSHDAAGKAVYVPTQRADHDQWGRTVAITDAAGNVTTTAHEQAVPGASANRVTSTSPDPDGAGPLAAHVSTTEIDDRWGVPTKVVDPSDATTQAEYDNLGRLVEVWKPGRPMGEGKPDVAYDYAIARASGGYNAVTTHTRVGDHDNTVESVRILDAFLRNRQTQTETRHTDPATGQRLTGRSIVSTAYNSIGGREEVDARIFDETGGPTTAFVKPVEQAPENTVYSYDGAGRVLTETTTWSGGEGTATTTTSYDGNITRTIPPEGGVATSTVVDPRGRTSELRQHPDGTPAGAGYQATRYDYDPAGNLTRVSDPAGNQWSYEYDLRGRRVSSVDPDAGASTQSYDELGQLTSTTDASGDTLAYTYDNLGRKTSMRDDSPSGQLRATWSYDTLELGLPSGSERYHDGQLAYTREVTGYDAANRPTGTRATLHQTPGLIPAEIARSYTTEQTWRADGTVATTDHLASGVLPGERLEHTYDELGRPTELIGSLGAYVLHTGWSVNGQVDQLALGNTYGHLSWQSFKYHQGSGRLRQMQVDRQTESFYDERTNYTYDPAGNITRLDTEEWVETDTVEGHHEPVETQCFDYDNLAQLTEAWTPASGDCTAEASVTGLGGPAPYWASYGYDDQTGNRTSHTWRTPAGTTSAAYSYGEAGAHAVSGVATTVESGTGDAQVQATTGTYGYTDDGHTASRPGPGDTDQALEWNAEGKLTEVTTSGGTVVQEALYGPEGDRLVRVADGVTTAYLPGGLEVQYDTETGEVSERRYYTHAGRTVAVRGGANPGTVSTLFADHHGTAQYAVGNGDSELTTRRQRPFGGPRGGQPTWPGERGFVGGTRDQDVGLVHVGARPYDPGLGRFATIDPLIDPADPQQMNGYTYANNNPTTLSDPTGLIPVMGGGQVHGNNSTNNPVVNGGTASVGGGTSNVSHPVQPPPGGTESTPAADPLPSAQTSGSNSASNCPFANQYRCMNPNADKMSWSDLGHGLLDGLGLVPGAGFVFDGTNCAWYGAEGDAVNAGLSCGAAVPLVGYGASAAKFGKAVKAAEEAANAGDDAGQLVYRVHGGEAGKWGHSWTTENPLEMANPRSRLGLPKVNAGENVTCARVCDMGGVRKRDALPLDGNPGGGPEWLFPNPQQQLQELWTFRMEPPL